MKTIEIEDARAPLAEYAEAVVGDPIILTRAGKPVAALISIANVDWETIRLSSHPTFLEIIEESRASLRREGGLTEEELRRRLDDA